MTTRETELECVAERVLVGSASGARILVRLGKPEMVTSVEWRAAVEIVRGDSRSTTRVLGYDAFHVLILAMQFIRDELDKESEPFTCEDGEAGDTGFPLFVPQHLGRDFARRMETTIKEEAEQFGARLRRSPKR